MPRYRDTPQRVREARAVAALREAHELLCNELDIAAHGQHEIRLTVDDYQRLHAS